LHDPDSARVVVEAECGILVYPPEEAGEPWRATFTENGRRRFRQAMTEAELAAKLEKVTERLRAGAADMESGTKWGRLRGERYGVRCPAEAGVPAVKVAGELVIEDAGADLEQEVGFLVHADHRRILRWVQVQPAAPSA